MEKRSFALITGLAVLLLISCSLSMTTTPTPDPTQCTDRGWTEIGNYMREFDVLLQTLGAGTSYSAYLAGLTDLKVKINEVSIDGCSEAARQKIVTGFESEIYGMQLSPTIENEQEAGMAFQNGMDLVWEAVAELEALNIIIDYP